MNGSDDLLGFLPQPGQSVEVRGGVVFCGQWHVRYTEQGAQGQIVLWFEVDAAKYQEQMARARLMEPPRLLAAGEPHDVEEPGG